MKTEHRGKKAYKKPAVTRVKLEIDEAVLAGCKTAPTISAKQNKNCNHSQCKQTQSPS
jgi:hypothetical protein